MSDPKNTTFVTQPRRTAHDIYRGRQWAEIQRLHDAPEPDQYMTIHPIITKQREVPVTRGQRRDYDGLDPTDQAQLVGILDGLPHDASLSPRLATYIRRYHQELL